MLDYQTLDTIADSFIPLLFIWALLLLAKSLVQRDYSGAIQHCVCLAYGLVLAYSMMFIDKYLSLWPSFGLDYSTHTAVAIVLLMTLWLRLNVSSAIWLGSYILYALLMLYQEYHSVADIITTALVVCVLMVPFVHFLKQKNSQAIQDIESTSVSI